MTTETQSQFARRLGVKPGYITQLKKDGRLVMAAGGRKVEVEASEARIKATRDPSKAHVADRHAQGRAPQSEQDIDEPDAPIDTPDYQHARARREHYAALQAELDYRKAAGDLMERGAVVAALSDILTVLRSGVESFPDVLAPQLAPIADEALVRARLADEVEILLGQVSERFAEMSAPA